LLHCNDNKKAVEAGVRYVEIFSETYLFLPHPLQTLICFFPSFFF